MRPAALTTAATAWAKELRAVGVNVNLAPVTDTVPADIGKGNEPIGKWGRQYGADLTTVVSRAAVAFLKGMRAGGVEGTVKHFGARPDPAQHRLQRHRDHRLGGYDHGPAPGAVRRRYRGRRRARHGLLGPLSQGSTRRTPPCFSPAIIDGLLRTRLGFDGVVITDDLNAAAAKVLPVAERAVKYVGAGGDILLTGAPEAAAPMAKALAAAATSPDFAEGSTPRCSASSPSRSGWACCPARLQVILSDRHRGVGAQVEHRRRPAAAEEFGAGSGDHGPVIGAQARARHPQARSRRPRSDSAPRRAAANWPRRHHRSAGAPRRSRQARTAFRVSTSTTASWNEAATSATGTVSPASSTSPNPPGDRGLQAREGESKRCRSRSRPVVSPRGKSIMTA